MPNHSTKINHPPISSATITPANISWQQDHDGLEVPISEDFGDVYFSRDNGLAETRHVFLQGNDIENRLTQLKDFDTFTIGELGFGTGLNVLAIWQLWRQIRSQSNQPHVRLHVVTTELFPLTKSDLQRALASWEDLAELSTQLIANYPPLIKGLHRLHFPDDNFSIDLWLGDASESLTQVQHGQIDAWFLDGFAPKCNESLWADTVLNQIQRLSVHDTTVATFSVAGVIKRGLTERGFSIAKVKGFGKKREMLTANFIDNTSANKSKLIPTKEKIAVIGAGIAGLSTAYALANRGHQITLFDKTTPLAGSSGNLRAMLAPKLTPIHHVHEHMHSISYLYSARFYTALNKKHAGIFEHKGVFDLLKQSNVSPEQINEYPTDFAHMLNSKDASKQANANLPEVMALDKAGLINPHALATFILKQENIHFIQAEISEIAENADITTVQGEQFIFDKVVLCTAQDCSKLIELPTPRTIRGQISWVDVTDSIAKKLPNKPLKYGGYCALVNQGDTQQFMMGASFIRGTTELDIKDDEHIISKDKLTNAIPSLTDTLNQFPNTCEWHGRAGLRAQMPDYLPLAGKVSETIYSLCAMGSKGFAYAPICADMLAGQMFGEVLPLPSVLVDKLNPLRFNSPKSY